MPLNPEDDMEQSAPQTESAKERGYDVTTDNRKFGSADHDADDGGGGDIADEGAGHRDVAPAAGRTPGSAEGERDRSEQSK
jgi:hypothetical protein